MYYLKYSLHNIIWLWEKSVWSFITVRLTRRLLWLQNRSSRLSAQQTQSAPATVRVWTSAVKTHVWSPTRVVSTRSAPLANIDPSAAARMVGPVIHKSSAINVSTYSSTLSNIILPIFSFQITLVEDEQQI